MKRIYQKLLGDFLRLISLFLVKWTLKLIFAVLKKSAEFNEHPNLSWRNYIYHDDIEICNGLMELMDK